MGYPVTHSRSPMIHRLFALQTGQTIRYELLQVAPEQLASAVARFRQTGGRGLNITVPHKIAVTELVDQLSERARRAGAVNTLIFDDGDISGDNTDGVGLIRDLITNLGLRLNGMDILVLGAGGATRGIVAPLIDAAPASLTIANRTLSRALEIKEDFKAAGPIDACRFEDVSGSQPFHLVINATSAGFKGETPPYPAAAINPGTVCYDLSYGLNATPFSAWAQDQGAARSVMGWGMLVEQAAESFHLWRGVRPDTSPVLKQIATNA